MPHGVGHCKGATRGPYNIRTMCRVCWNKLSQNNGITIPLTATIAPTPSLPTRPPCIHLGPIIEYASLPGCNKHIYDCAIHERCKAYQWDSKPMACCVGCKDDPRNTPIPDTTIAITHWNRPDALKRLLASIEMYMPGMPIEIEDTGGNLSAGRNRLYGRIKTTYIVIAEEDFVVLPGTLKGLQDALAILEHDPGISGVGGVAAEPSRGNVRWGHNWIKSGNKVRPTPSTRLMRKTPGGITYRPCQLVLNWGLFRTEIFHRVPWDEDFAIQEHQMHFWNMTQAGLEFAFYKPLRINHLRDRPTKHYHASRYRSFAHLVKQKHGFTFGHEV